MREDGYRLAAAETLYSQPTWYQHWWRSWFGSTGAKLWFGYTLVVGILCYLLLPSWSKPNTLLMGFWLGWGLCQWAKA